MVVTTGAWVSVVGAAVLVSGDVSGDVAVSVKRVLVAVVVGRLVSGDVTIVGGMEDVVETSLGVVDSS